MFLQEKLAQWYENETNRSELNAILRSPVFIAAVELAILQAESEPLDESVAPPVVVERRYMRNRGMRFLTSRLESLIVSPNAMQPGEQEPEAFGHIDENYFSNTKR